MAILTAPEIADLLTVEELALLDYMTPPERRALIHRLSAEETERREHPLAHYILWDNEKPRTSQKRAARGLGQDATGVFGGNGSGKTVAGAALTVAAALGRNHPDVAAFIEANDLDPSWFPPDGCDALASSLNGDLSVSVQRPAVDAFLPPGCTWRNQAAPGPSTVTLPNGHKIIFKTNDAGARAYQGFAVGLVWLDEEHDEAVYNECLQRISRVRWEGRSGWVLLTMTPLKGRTWVYRRFISEPDEGTAHHFLHGGDNPHIDQVKRARLLKGYGQHEREARDKGMFVALEGRIYKTWSRDVHVVPSFIPPASWPRFSVVDFGTRNPTGILWAALDPADDVLHVHRVSYEAEQTQEWQARRHIALTDSETEVLRKRWLDELGKDEDDLDAQEAAELEAITADPLWTVADPADRGARMTWQRQGVRTVPARKGKGSVRAGISAVAERLEPDAEGKPHLVVHDNCVPLMNEFEGYVWKTSRTNADMPDEPLEKDDHLLDGLRYLVTRIAQMGGLYVEDDEDDETQ